VRRDVGHKISHALVKDNRFKLYVLESLQVRNMTSSAKGTVAEPGRNVAQKAGLNKALLGAVLGQTRTYLQYKARRGGKLCLEVPPHYSSQECAACGFTHPDNRPTQAGFVCQRCENRDNADFNAAKVIARRGVALLLSDTFKVKEKKRVAIKRQQVGAGCSEPAALPPPLVETCVRRLAPQGAAQQSMKQETPTTSRRL
jgi:putative transposase